MPGRGADTDLTSQTWIAFAMIAKLIGLMWGFPKLHRSSPSSGSSRRSLPFAVSGAAVGAVLAWKTVFPVDLWHIAALASGASVAITTTISLPEFPRLAIDGGLLRLETAAVATRAAAPTSPAAHIERASIVFDLSGRSNAPPGRIADDASPPSPQHAALESLTHGKINHLTLSNGTLLFKHGVTGTRLDHVDADVKLKSGQSVTATGKAHFAGRPISFDLTISKPTSSKRARQYPFTLSLAASGFSSKLAGEINATAGVRIDAKSEIVSDDVRNLVGALQPMISSDGPTVAAAITGQLAWADGVAAFQDATLQVGGSTATGTLALSWPAKNRQPLLSGTIALESIDLTGTKMGNPGKVSPQPLDLPFEALGLRHLDADLRISVNRIKTANYELTKFATSLSLRGGEMRADIAELDIEGGVASGQIDADMNRKPASVALRAKIDHKDLAPVLSRIAGRPIMSGGATVVLELAGEGGTTARVAESLSGTATLTLKAGAQVAVDIKALENATNGGTENIWKVATRGTTTVDQMGVTIHIQDGKASAENLNARAGAYAVRGRGQVDVRSQEIDVSLVIDKSTEKPGTDKKDGRSTTSQNVLRLKGALSAPSVEVRQNDEAPEPHRARPPQSPG